MLIHSRSRNDTQKIARILARACISGMDRAEGALVISLEGNLGAGKTTFMQGFARALGIAEKVASPTFVVMKRYEIRVKRKAREARRHLYHFDCYRIEKTEELAVLGWHGIIADPANIVCIEWGDKVRRVLPPAYLRIAFAIGKGDRRRLSITAHER